MPGPTNVELPTSWARDTAQTFYVQWSKKPKISRQSTQHSSIIQV